MANSPCGGCPPCCPKCVFSLKGTPATVTETVVTAEEYGCIKGFGKIVKDAAGRLGQMRDNNFHAVSKEGATFLRQSGNPLAAHCA